MLQRLAMLVVVSALAACAQPPARIVQAPPPVLLQDPDAVCLSQLQTMNVQYQPVAEFGDPDQGCGIDNPVKVSATGTAWNRPGVVSCPMAQTISRFEADVVQPAALANFGKAVRRIHHAGTYDCRVRRTQTKVAASLGGSRGGRLSEHSKGRAIDVMAFELEDGTMVSVKNDWRGKGAKSSFLQQVARASCSVFNVTLTPNHDRLHADHLHLDIGPYNLCGY